MEWGQASATYTSLKQMIWRLEPTYAVRDFHAHLNSHLVNVLASIGTRLIDIDNTTSRFLLVQIASNEILAREHVHNPVTAEEYVETWQVLINKICDLGMFARKNQYALQNIMTEFNLHFECYLKGEVLTAIPALRRIGDVVETTLLDPARRCFSCLNARYNGEIVSVKRLGFWAEAFRRGFTNLQSMLRSAPRALCLEDNVTRLENLMRQVLQDIALVNVLQGVMSRLKLDSPGKKPLRLNVFYAVLSRHVSASKK